MACSLRHPCLVAGLLLGLSWCAWAQQPSRERLRLGLQRLSAQSDPRNQLNALLTWQRQWQEGRYPPDSTYINGLLHVALVYLYRSDYPAATRTVRQALRYCQPRRPDVAADQPAKALYRLGMLLSEQNQPAIATLKQAVQQGQGIRSADQWVASAYLYLAYAHYSSGELQQALDYIERGEQIAINTKITSLIVKLLLEKAKVLNDLAQYVLARRSAERAVALAEQDPYPAVTARAYQLLGVTAKNQGEFADALRYGKLAFNLALRSQDPTAPNYAVSLGELSVQLNHYNQAITYFRFGFAQNTNAYAKAYALMKLGQVYHQQQAYTLALWYYQQALNVMPLGFHQSAVTYLPGAEIIQQADQKDYLLSLILSKANTWLAYAKHTDNNPQRLQRALAAYKVADRMVDYMRWEHTTDGSKLYWRQTTRSLYENAVEACALLNNAGQAFQFIEKSRAVMLGDQLAELGARKQLSAQQAIEETKHRDAVRKAQAELSRLTTNSTAYGRARSTLFAAQERLHDFLKQLEQSNPAYYRYKYDRTTTSLADLRPYLNARSASFVTYFVGDSSLYVLGVTNRQTTLLRRPLGAYRQTVRAFMVLLADPDAMNRKAGLDRFWALGNGLYRQLFAPLNVPAGRVIISPDGAFVPFETLSRQVHRPDYLVNEYAFSYVYSARLLLKRTGSVPTAGWHQTDFVGVAPVAFAPALGQATLAGSDAALQTIGGRFGSATLLMHGAATRRAFQSRVADARVIHLFTHALADSTDREPLLYFADSTLRLSDLGDGGLPYAQLVVLAACKTGIGSDQRGEGVFSLARGFVALGVPSILTTLWSVENRATYGLTDLFYQYIAEGLPKDVALQRAKQTWLQTADGAAQSPNRWAGLILVGDTAPLRKTNPWPWIASGTLLVAGSAVGWWFRRRRLIQPRRRVNRLA